MKTFIRMDKFEEIGKQRMGRDMKRKKDEKRLHERSRRGICRTYKWAVRVRRGRKTSR